MANEPINLETLDLAQWQAIRKRTQVVDRLERNLESFAGDRRLAMNKAQAAFKLAQAEADVDYLYRQRAEYMDVASQVEDLPALRNSLLERAAAVAQALLEAQSAVREAKVVWAAANAAWLAA